MNYPYSSFFVDIQLAKRRSEQILMEGPGVPGDFLPPQEQKSIPNRISIRQTVTERKISGGAPTIKPCIKMC